MIVSVSLALLFPMFGSEIPPGGVTVAVFDRKGPEALMLSVPVAVNVAVPPQRRFTVWLMFAEPLAAAQLERTPAEPFGSTFAPKASEAPPFAAWRGLAVGKLVDCVRPVT